MTLPVPLGVRCYSIVDAAERWVTRWVDDITFRSVVPGGFASATITLRVPRHLEALPSPDPLAFSQLTELFRRIQVVDLRTMEIAWEGRIEDPARQVEPDTWQIGALGSMAAASDISRPVFYIDTSLDRWVPGEAIGADGGWGTSDPTMWQNEKDDASRTLTTTFQPIFSAVDLLKFYSWRWDSHGFDQPIARFTTTHVGSTSNDAAPVGNIQMLIGIASNPTIDVTAYSAGSTTKTNVIGTDFTDTNTRYIVFGITMKSGTGSYGLSDGEVMQQKIINPVIVGMRRDRFGNKLTTASNYTTDSVTVAQVVEDVVGRYLVGGWYELGNNTPYPGSVRPQDVYIDTSNTTQILHLVYDQGATAADILNDMMNQVQPNAYWAIWESKWTAADPETDFGINSGFRFEWATWPGNVGYVASSQDGFEGQPNGDNVYNFVFYRYQSTGDNNTWHVTTKWIGGGVPALLPELWFGGFTRSVTVNKNDPTSDSNAGNLAESYVESVNSVMNAGTLTVRRPIPYFDTGQNSASGAGRMVDPWMIRPGKLIRITDLPPRAWEHDLSAGTQLPDHVIDGTIFRVVATEYNSSDNSCRVELDQVTRWQIPTQISSISGGSKTIRIQ